MTPQFELPNRPLRILHVDDDEEDFIIIRDLVEAISLFDSRIEWESSYAEAIDVLIQNTYDVCLMDYFMGQHTGLQLFQEARKLGSRVPVIMLTGTGNRSVDLQAMERGISYYVSKNEVSTFDLERAIRYCLQHDALERGLLDSNERLNVIFNTTTDAILVVNFNGLVEYANSAFERLFALRPEAYLQQHINLVVAASQHSALDEFIQQVIVTGNVQRSEMPGVRADGSSIDIEISLARVNHEERIVCNLHDISHYKSVERMKNQFISMVNHELRTPITSTLLAVQMVHNYFDQMTPEKAKEKLEQCIDQIGNLREVVDGIMDLSEVEAKERKRGTAQVSVADSLEKVANSLQPEALKKKQNLSLNVSDERFTVMGSSLDFTRIWRNLISNAIKYTPAEGNITVRLTCLRKSNENGFAESNLAEAAVIEPLLDLKGSDYMIGQVQDDGYGIRAQDMPGLFERFDRGWAKNSDIPGTGLGLALVRELLNIYDGDIHVSSEVDKGSIFTFWIPLDPR
jgi:PAS domain S-box-containing protein